MPKSGATRALERKDRELKELRSKLKVAERVVEILRDYILNGDDPAEAKDSASARAKANAQAGKRRGPDMAGEGP